MTNDSHDELSFHVADGFEPVDQERQTPDLLRHTGVQWPSLKDDSTEPPTDVVVLTDELLRSAEGLGVTPSAHEERAPALPARTVTPASAASTQTPRTVTPSGAASYGAQRPRTLTPAAAASNGAVASTQTPRTVTPELATTAAPVAAVAPSEALLDTMKSPAVRVASLPLPAGPTTTEALQAIRPRRWVMVAVVATLVVAVFGGLLLREAVSAPAPTPSVAAPLSAPPLLPAVPELELVEFPQTAPPLEVAVQQPATEPPPASDPPASRHHSRPARRPTRTVPATDLLDAWQ